MQLNGQPILLDAPALIIDGATMVPLRFVGESFGAEVRWMAPTQTVIITNPAIPTPSIKALWPPRPTHAGTVDQAPVADNSSIGDQAPVAVAAPLFTAQELDDLLAPIALYPDPLLAQILPASTFPEQLATAAKLVPLRAGNEIIDRQNWDVSVKAVAYYPIRTQYDGGQTGMDHRGRTSLCQSAE